VDYANYLFEYKSYSVNIILNYYRKDSKRLVEVLFDDETWTIDLIKNKITDSSNNVLFEEKKFEVIETYYQQMIYFIDAIKNKNQTMNSLHESFEILKLCLNSDDAK
jgi:hypothetical protein